jgi:putative intracellular protease/amidase
MPSALILIADGSEEIEFVTPYDGISTLDIKMMASN